MNHPIPVQILRDRELLDEFVAKESPFFSIGLIDDMQAYGCGHFVALQNRVLHRVGVYQ
jgi:hypothetical protein